MAIKTTIAKIMRANAINSEDFTKEIYKDLKTSIKREIVIKDENNKAKVLQQFLRDIKNVQKSLKGKSPSAQYPFQGFWDQFNNGAMMQELYEVHPQLFTDGLFLDIPSSNSQNFNQELGLLLERGIAQVVKTAETKMKGTGTYTETTSKMVGTTRASVPDVQSIKKSIQKQVSNTIYKEAQKALYEYRKEEKTPNYNITTGVSGKVDVKGINSTIQCRTNINLSPNIQKALINSTFTLKNYLSSGKISLGGTNPYRVFLSITSGSIENKNARYLRMLNCFKYHSTTQHTQTWQYFYRSKAIYELTGIGQHYVDNNFLNDIGLAKFLIYNNPKGDIYVISTANIVNKIIDKEQLEMPVNWEQALYGPVKVKKTDLIELA